MLITADAEMIHAARKGQGGIPHRGARVGQRADDHHLVRLRLGGQLLGDRDVQAQRRWAPGDVVRIPFSDPVNAEHIGGGQLPFRGGIAQGPDGAMYATVFAAGTTTANGAVMRIASN
jgi:hypothetical protein